MIANLFKILFIGITLCSYTTVYYSDRGDFKMIFPYDYSIEIDTADVAIGIIPVTKVFCKEPAKDSLIQKNNSLYFMSIMEYPELTFPKDSLSLMEFIVDHSIEQQLLSLNGVLDYESDLGSKDYFGKIVRISSKEDPLAITKAKYIIYQDYFIVLQVKTIRNDPYFRKTEDFLNSFKVINP